MKLNDIRSIFLNFFHKNNHQILPSSSLIPHNDPSLMFVNSGMVQFKNYFTGEQKPNFTRVTTSQKSIRAGGKHNDLDNVGYTARHHTFFEMLGNFSFADYFKDEAIFYAWNLLTKDLGLAKDKLYVTVYHEDEEAANIWRKVASISDDRIIRIKTSDNFWSMGDTGPCGPCSEIFYDHGPSVAGGLPGSADQDGDRYIEIWNLVFMQYEQLPNGERVKLPRPCIDTGMGLERIAAVLQNVHNNYDIDLFKNIINSISDIAGVKITDKNISSFRVIADHLRSSSFLIADGVMPSNEGRGYVLRRIMRRAMRHIHVLGGKDLLMHKLVDNLCHEMGDTYPELHRTKEVIKSNFYNEENKFRDTINHGMKLLETSRSSLQNGKLPGEVAFKLYDTYGFPLDLTVDILRPDGVEVDMHGFDAEMAKQKENARKAWKGSGASKEDPIWFELYQQHGATEFVGYVHDHCQAIVLAKIENDDSDIIITNQTPFYGESGGQIGDVGSIDVSGKKVIVKDTKKFLGKIIAHIVEKSSIKIGDVVELAIDVEHRSAVKRNHSATHLLHHVLRRILGEHVVQKGSLVSDQYLRFDFAHNQALTKAEIQQVETEVNNLILANCRSSVELMPINAAMEKGAMALFGEKYDEEVRVVQFDQSIELCGGTHIDATGDIGSFLIVSEGSIASGVRRIEALTGKAVVKYIQKERDFRTALESLLKVSADDQLIKVEKLLSEKKSLERQLAEAKMKFLSGGAGDSSAVEKIGSVNFIFRSENINPGDLRNLADRLRKSEKTFVLLVSSYENKSSLVIAISSDLPDNAGSLVKDLAAKFSVSGGGKKDLAQAGGFDFAELEKIKEYIKDHLRNSKDSH